MLAGVAITCSSRFKDEKSPPFFSLRGFLQLKKSPHGLLPLVRGYRYPTTVHSVFLPQTAGKDGCGGICICCIVIAGPNGAGKTTFAREYLPREGGIIHFVKADLIASGLSPLRPELAARRAGRLELSRLSKERKYFAVESTFESTLSGRTYLGLLSRWKEKGYEIEVIFLRLTSVDIALQRIAAA